MGHKARKKTQWNRSQWGGWRDLSLPWSRPHAAPGRIRWAPRRKWWLWRPRNSGSTSSSPTSDLPRRTAWWTEVTQVTFWSLKSNLNTFNWKDGKTWQLLQDSQLWSVWRSIHKLSLFLVYVCSLDVTILTNFPVYKVFLFPVMIWYCELLSCFYTRVFGRGTWDLIKPGILLSYCFSNVLW